MNCSHRFAVAALVSVPIALGLSLSAPTAQADPDVGSQICNLIGQRGANLRGFMSIDVMLKRQGVRDPVGLVRQSVASECPQYSAALDESDREAGAWNQANGPNGGPGYGSCPPNSYYVPNRGECER